MLFFRRTAVVVEITLDVNSSLHFARKKKSASTVCLCVFFRFENKSFFFYSFVRYISRIVSRLDTAALKQW